MRRKDTVLILITMIVTIVFTSVSTSADSFADNGIDITQYLGMTYRQIQEEFPNVFEMTDSFGNGREFLTDGVLCFYFDYYYSPEEQYDAKVNRIVITNNDNECIYRIGRMMSIGATYTDEYIYMEGEGYTQVLSTGDLRNIWSDGQHIVIVTRGQWASCCEIDISLRGEDS